MRILPRCAAVLVILANTSAAILAAGMPSCALAADPRENQGIAAVPGDDCWRGPLDSALDGDVYALAVDGAGNLYVGGAFTRIGETSAARIAKWDGRAWSAMGGGMDSSVLALAVAPNGDLYAAGTFTTAGTLAASRIARWDGSAWSPLATGMDAAVNALTINADGDVFAGGAFSTAGSASASRIARWDGLVWSSLSSGMDGDVLSLASDTAGRLYAGGAFLTAGGVGTNRVATWDGASWSALDVGVNAPVLALAVGPNDTLYAGGAFTMAGSDTARGIAVWDGSTWTTLGAGFDGPVNALYLDATGTLQAAGAFLASGTTSVHHVAKWNGTTWDDVYAGVNDAVHAIVGAPGVTYIGGTFTTASNRDAAKLAHRFSFSWFPVNAAPIGPVYDAVVDQFDNLYVGGDFDHVGGISAIGIAKWDGHTWSAVGSGLDAHINSVAIGRDGKIYVAGYLNHPDGAYPRIVARWDGSTWVILGHMNFAITSIAVDSAGVVYAGGDFTQIDGATFNHIARWIGFWSSLGSGLSFVAHLAIGSDGLLYAPGSHGLYKWTGTAWSTISTGFPVAQVGRVAFDRNGTLYASGPFTTIAGVAANRIARYDGAKWSPLGYGSSSDANVFCVDGGGNLYATGTFTSLSGDTIAGIAKWNGSHWSPLGSGVDSEVGSSVVAATVDSKGNLYVGGSFMRAGSEQAAGLARWQSLTIARSNPTLGTPTSDLILNGTHFETATSVRFNGLSAQFAATSDTTLTVTVPPGATTGPLSIEGCEVATSPISECFRIGPHPDLPLCLASRPQSNPVSIPDGTGGAILAWSDMRSDGDIYAQRVNGAGQVLWGPDGVPVTLSSRSQRSPAIATDGAGGAIIVWEDYRISAFQQVNAQRLSSAGTPMWQTSGVSVGSGSCCQSPASPRITADSSGGAIVAWSSGSSVMAQRLDSSGAQLWGSSGRTVTSGSTAAPVVIAPDGSGGHGVAGGAIIAWQDNRNGNYDIYAQRVSSGNVVQWTTNGVAISAAVGDQRYPEIVADGAGGAIIAWRDSRNGNTDIFAQRISSAGLAQWAATGVGLCTSPGGQDSVQVVTDGEGGAFLAWQDARAGDQDIYSQHVLSNGSVATGWSLNGNIVFSGIGNQDAPRLVDDGSGGAIVAWRDFRNGSKSDLYSQNLSAGGQLQWDVSGAAVCLATDDQDQLTLVGDGTGGAFASWRDAGGTCQNIYGQHVRSTGLILSAPANGGAVAQAWPNPFSGKVTIDFSLPRPTAVRLEVFDVTGRRVWMSPLATSASGPNRLEWDGQTKSGLPLGPGIYYLRVRGPGVDLKRTVVRLR